VDPKVFIDRLLQKQEEIDGVGRASDDSRVNARRRTVRIELAEVQYELDGVVTDLEVIRVLAMQQTGLEPRFSAHSDTLFEFAKIAGKRAQ
jgi:hypothetical protein